MPVRVTHSARPITEPAAHQQSSRPLRATYPTQSLRFLQRLDDINAERKITENGYPTQAKLPLSVLIVGGGLGGLATAVALARRGHSVVVLEQAPQLEEVGAGIQIPPNSGMLLERLGVMKHLRDRAVLPESIRLRRWSNGQVIGLTKLSPEFEENFASPYCVVHRSDFHEALHKRAVELGVKLLLNSRVVGYNPADPSVTLANGSVMSADIVIAADGIRSLAREIISPGPVGAPKDTGFAAYRATVEVENMKQFPELAWVIENPNINIWIGEGRHVMTYPISAGKTFNMVLSHKDYSDPSTWNNKEVLEDIKKEFAGWDPQLMTIIGLIEKAMKWPLRSGGRLRNWVAPSSKLLTLGDAAHAMVPYMSQGAAMAVEDGAALAIALNQVERQSEVASALHIFQKERIERTGQMQDASMMNGHIWHFADGPEQEARDNAMRAEVIGRPFVASANQWSDPTTQCWAYGYDAEHAMEEAMYRARSEVNGNSAC
ncbi:hypothetical protein F5X99DRAFT_430557 [Biscogniauxia marginata]|nr:hypothetical protein F5X99DRAFT_430557 [Biscogniauxia marginata]